MGVPTNVPVLANGAYAKLRLFAGDLVRRFAALPEPVLVVEGFYTTMGDGPRLFANRAGVALLRRFPEAERQLFIDSADRNRHGVRPEERDGHGRVCCRKGCATPASGGSQC